MAPSYLVRQHLGPGLLCLLLVDELHQDSLVLEHVTLGLEVKFTVQMSVNLLGLSAKHKSYFRNYLINQIRYKTPN